MINSMLLRGIVLLLALAPATLTRAQINPDDLLPVEQAFALRTVLADDQKSLALRWEVADGYYMYRHAFRFDAESEGLDLGEPDIPAGKAYTDEFFGEVEVYRGAVDVRIPVQSLPAESPLELRVSFQGCADLGVCYPPQRQAVALAFTPGESPVAPRADAATTAGGSVLDQFGLNSGSSGLTGRGDPLPPEQAFRVETIALDAGRLLARFTVHPEYYLYRHTIEFESATAPLRVAGLELPPARRITDEYFGETDVYYNEVEIPVVLERPAGPEQQLDLDVRFQGCQIDGICYPPMTRRIAVSVPAADEPVRGPDPIGIGAGDATDDATGASATAAGAAPAVPESDQDRLARLIEEQPLALTLAMFVLLGVGLAFTPCVFPMVPILSGIIAGEGENVTRGKAFSLSLAYVMAMALTYTVVGVVAALAGYNLQAMFQNPWVLGSFAAIFVALAMAMFGFYNLQLPSSWQARLTEISNRQSGGSLLGAGIMGFLSALIVGPCVTAPLIGILIFISQTGDAVLGGSVLFALSIGMGMPLLAIGVGLGHWLPRAGGWMDSVKAVFGVLLLALAIWMLERVVPGGVNMLLWGLLLVGSGTWLGGLTLLPDTAGGWVRTRQAAGVVLLAFGLMQLVGAAAGGNDWLRPLAPFAGGPGGGATAEAAPPRFTRVETLADLERAVAASTRPVFLDFYADWCIDCKRMERRSFPDPAVADAMRGFDLLKIDMTDFNDEHQRVLNRFSLHGPPAYLFFSGGRELDDYRMFGFMPPTDFLAHLERVRQAAR